MNRTSRARKKILVPHVSAIGMIGVARALGASGYDVHVCSSGASDTGLHCKYASHTVVCPSYDLASFVPWLREYISRHNIDAIIPSEGLIVAIREHFDEFSDLMPVPSSWDTVQRCFSKALYFEFFQQSADSRLTENIPPYVVCRRSTSRPTENDFSELGSHLFLKTDDVLRDGSQGPAVSKLSSEDDIAAAIGKQLASYPAVLIQGSVPGVKATCNLLIQDGQPVVESMCLAKHENPYTGGLTVLRKTWWHQAIRDDAVMRLRALEWDGVAMMEYKYVADTGEWWFIEANTRYWSALNLDLHAGTDFPTAQVDAFFGLPPISIPKQPIGIICRHTVPGEIGYVVTQFRDPNVSWGQRICAALQFFWLFLDPRVKSDLYFPGDRKLYWYQWLNFLKNLGKP